MDFDTPNTPLMLESDMRVARLGRCVSHHQSVLELLAASCVHQIAGLHIRTSKSRSQYSGHLTPGGSNSLLRQTKALILPRRTLLASTVPHQPLCTRCNNLLSTLLHKRTPLQLKRNTTALRSPVLVMYSTLFCGNIHCISNSNAFVSYCRRPQCSSAALSQLK